MHGAKYSRGAVKRSVHRRPRTWLLSVSAPRLAQLKHHSSLVMVKSCPDMFGTDFNCNLVCRQSVLQGPCPAICAYNAITGRIDCTVTVQYIQNLSAIALAMRYAPRLKSGTAKNVYRPLPVYGDHSCCSRSAGFRLALLVPGTTSAHAARASPTILMPGLNFGSGLLSLYQYSMVKSATLPPD
jgi:hypothetical protein